MNIKLKFTTPKGFKNIKTEILETLLPIHVMEENQLKSPVVQLEVPILFSAKDEKFAFFLPDGFLQDYGLHEIKSDAKISIFRDKENNHCLGFLFPSLKELRDALKNPESHYSKFKEQYESHLLDIKNGELVLVVAFKSEKSNVYFQSNQHVRDLINNDVIGSKATFEYFKAYKFNNRYYLLDKDGNLNRNSNFVLNKNVPQSMNYLVMPYTEDDWNLVSRIHQKINHLKNNIFELFESQKDAGVLDKPLEEGHFLMNKNEEPKKLKHNP